MPTHNPNDPVDVPEPQPGYEASDVSVPGILEFLVSLGVSVVIFFVFCFGMGKVINNALVKHDGPPNKWNQLAETEGGKPANMASNPAMEQQQLQQMTQRFPTPRLETDDGNQDLADLHERESLLLEHYSWVDRAQGKVRIPIERAMEILATKGLPVVAAGAEAQQAELPTETGSGAMALENGLPKVQAPLTNGFAPTAYEQELASSRRAPGEMGTGGRNQ